MQGGEIAAERPNPAGDLSTVTRARRLIRAFLVGLVIVLAPVLGIAGGLGMAPTMAVLGIAAALVGLTKRGARVAPGGWSTTLMVFALWAALSSLWSNYPVPGGLGLMASNPVKLLFGLVLYISAAGAILFSAMRAPDRFQTLALAAMALLAGLALIDAMTGFGLSLAVDPLEPGGNLDRRLRDAEMNVGHGITLGLLLLGPAMIGAWRRYPDWRGWAMAAAFAACLAIASARIGLSVGVLGVFGVIAVLALAWVMPRATVIGVSGLGVLTIILAPVLAKYCLTLTPETKAGLPFSWEHRVEGWAHIGERIAERPIVGHGFDAVRTFDATQGIRGYDMSLVSLHPHNAGLHIWVETGMIGAGLAVIALISIAGLAAEWAGAIRERAMAVASLLLAGILVSSVSYGVWQEWWWASLFFAAAMCAVLTREA